MHIHITPMHVHITGTKLKNMWATRADYHAKAAEHEGIHREFHEFEAEVARIMRDGTREGSEPVHCITEEDVRRILAREKAPKGYDLLERMGLFGHRVGPERRNH